IQSLRRGELRKFASNSARPTRGPASSIRTDAPRWSSIRAVRAPQIPEPSMTKSADNCSDTERSSTWFVGPTAIATEAVAGRLKYIADHFGVEGMLIGQHLHPIAGVHHAEEPGSRYLARRACQLGMLVIQGLLKLQRVDLLLVDQRQQRGDRG